MSHPTWREFFNRHAPHYDENPFTQNTRFEVDFMLELFDLPDGARILDMGCGTGRHSIELAQRGYAVTGVDISAGMLAVAHGHALASGVSVDFVESDGTAFIASAPFDAAICVCEGGFGLTDLQDEPVSHDLAMLRSIHSALKQGAPFLLTALNGYAIIRQMTDEMVEQRQFDPSTMIAVYEDTMNLPEGTVQMLIKERQFIAPELVAMLHHVGFRVEHVWGGTAGEWARRPIKLDEVEVMYVARKTS